MWLSFQLPGPFFTRVQVQAVNSSYSPSRTVFLKQINEQNQLAWTRLNFPKESEGTSNLTLMKLKW